jgi:hypothetical protein
MIHTHTETQHTKRVSQNPNGQIWPHFVLLAFQCLMFDSFCIWVLGGLVWGFGCFFGTSLKNSSKD